MGEQQLLQLPQGQEAENCCERSTGLPSGKAEQEAGRGAAQSREELVQCLTLYLGVYFYSQNLNKWKEQDTLALKREPTRPGAPGGPGCPSCSPWC